MSQQILIVEDEIKLAELLRDYLLENNYQIQMLHDGDEVESWLRSHQPDLILLDLMLPGTDGMTICKHIRRTSLVPIIMITAKVAEIDRLLGLELGADDYICKPFSPREVVARVRAVLRRANTAADTELSVNSVNLQLNVDTFQVTLNGQPIELTQVEFQLLKTLYERPGQIFTRDVLMNHIYQDNRIVSGRTIDSHVKKIRKKLQAIIPEQEMIHSVYGAGYKYEG